MHDRNVVSAAPLKQPVSPDGAVVWLQRALRDNARNLGLLVCLLAAIAFVSWRSPTYLSYDNLLVVTLQMAFVGIAALGMTALIISGYVDLSIGSMFGVCAAVATMTAKDTSPVVGILVGIALGGAIGLLNGALVWRINISPIIITLGGLTLLHGVLLLLTNGFALTGVPASYGTLGQARPLGIPMPVMVLVALSPIAYVILQRTTIGRHIFAIGGNSEAAAAAGLRVRRIVLASFAVNGVLVGIAAVLASSRYGGADPSFGTAMELDVITAVILGGVAFNGGEGGIGGVLLAVALLGVINSGLVAIGIDPYYAEVVKGGVLIVAVAIDQFSHEQRARYQRYLAMRERRAEEVNRAAL